jgi:hypothetical protein
VDPQDPQHSDKGLSKPPCNIIIIRDVIFNENEFPIGDFEFFKDELMIIDTKALAQYIRDKTLPSAELIWKEKCESTSPIKQMLQGADDQKNDDHQEAKYTTAKFKLITPPKLPPIVLLLHIIQSSYPTKTLKQDLIYRHNNASKSASIRILNARERSINYGILDIHRCNTNCGILDVHRYNINYGILDAHRYNDFSKILDALRI